MEQVNELYKLVKTFCRNWNIYNEDIVQDLVWDVYQRLELYFDESKSNFSTFVFMNCKNCYLTSMTKKVEMVPLDKEEDDGITKLETVKYERDSYISYIYENVCSDILKDYLKGFKQKDIAKQYGIPYSTCNQRIMRELNEIKEAYAK